MLDPLNLGIENKAMRPPVFGPGTYTCPNCGVSSHVLGNSAEPPRCPDCKNFMKAKNQANG